MVTYPQAIHAQETRAASVKDVRIPFRDARNNGPNSTRFAAGQFSQKAPTIVLFGMSRERWPLVRDAIKQAAFNGFPVNGVFMGSTDQPPSLEIFADGQHVTRSINPNTIEGPVLTRLIEDIVREFY